MALHDLQAAARVGACRREGSVAGTYGMAHAMSDWHQDIALRMMVGERPMVVTPRRSGKHRAMVEVGAYLEALLENWEVVGDGEQAQRLRREARELAARRVELWE
jgi:hypothetical protein